MIKKLIGFPLFLSLLLVGAASAQSAGPTTFSIDWYTIDAGGGQSTGGIFTLTGTIGQPDANFGGAIGGVYGFVGGFWGGAIDFLFLDGFEQR